MARYRKGRRRLPYAGLLRIASPVSAALGGRKLGSSKRRNAGLTLIRRRLGVGHSMSIKLRRKGRRRG